MVGRFSAADKRALVVCFLAALLVRAGVVTLTSERLQADTDGYGMMAENLRVHGVYGVDAGDGVQASAFRPPLYPAILATLVQNGKLSLSRVAMLHVLIGALTAALAFVAAAQPQYGKGTRVLPATNLDVVVELCRSLPAYDIEIRPVIDPT